MSKPDPDGGVQTRRQFLAKSGVLAGASVAGTLDLSRSADAAGNDLREIGLIGCGGGVPGRSPTRFPSILGLACTPWPSP